MKTGCVVFVVACGVSLNSLAATRYVSLSGSGTPPYTNWATAAQTIQTAVDYASPGDEIIVADGTYASGTTLTPGSTTSNRVVITTAVTVRSAQGPAQCIIRGHQINNNEAVRCAYVANGGQLIGVTLSNGFAPSFSGLLQSSGAGVFIAQGSLVSNCLITCNESRGYGGGAYLHMGGTLANCTVISNTSTAWSGGGVCLYNGGEVHGCQIRNNYGLSGGGVACITNGLVANSTIAGNVRTGFQMSGGMVTGCVIALNHGADAHGGGVEAAAASLILGCTIVSNTSSQGYGGGVELYYNMSVIDGCLIAWNSSTHPDGPVGGHGGGGVRMVSGGIMRNSVLRNNRADNGGGIFASSYANSNMIENCILESNHSYGYGGGLYGYGSGPASLTWLSNTTLRANTSSNDGGGVNYSVNLQLVACGIISNRAIDGDGGGIYISEWSPNATSAVCGCTIQDNHARFTGGGIYTSGGLVQHCVLAGNYGMSSAGAYLYKSTLRNCLVMYNRSTNSAAVTAVLTSLVENCTISDNTVYNTNGIGGVSIFSGSLARNTIVYHNIPRDISRAFSGTSGAMFFAHCCLSTNITGNGNINANPLFSNRAGNDYRLLEGSPCVDAGTNQPWMFLPYPNNVDIYGQPRVQNLIVDIGAAEGVIPEPLWLAWLLPCTLAWRRTRWG